MAGSGMVSIHLQLGLLGYVIIGVFIVAWIIAASIYRLHGFDTP